MDHIPTWEEREGIPTSAPVRFTDPLYYFRREWDRILIRPDDLRALDHRIRGGVGEPVRRDRPWRLYSWSDRFQGSGGSLDSLIIEISARWKTLLELEFRIARTPPDVTLYDVEHAPRRTEPPPSSKNRTEAAVSPVEACLTISRESPAAVLEVLSRSDLAGNSIMGFVTPHLDEKRRRAPEARRIGVIAVLLVGAIPGAFLVLGWIGSVLALPAVLVIGAGSLLGARAAMDWLFPPLELMPNALAKTRWQITWQILAALVTIVGVAVGVAALFQ